MTSRSAITIAVAIVLTLFAVSCGTSANEPVAAGDQPADDTTKEPPATTTEPPATTTEPPADDDTTNDDLPVGAGPYPVGTLEITITHPDHETVSYTVSCLGDTATITPPTEGLSEIDACGRLGDPEVQALLVQGPPAGRLCTEQYGGPDEAAITGTLDGQPVDVTIDRSNGCGIGDWDGILASVLPPAK